MKLGGSKSNCLWNVFQKQLKMWEEGICFYKILQQELAKKEKGICFRNVFIKRMKGGRGS